MVRESRLTFDPKSDVSLPPVSGNSTHIGLNLPDDALHRFGGRRRRRRQRSHQEHAQLCLGQASVKANRIISITPIAIENKCCRRREGTSFPLPPEF
jgi:hypothetical protein